MTLPLTGSELGFLHAAQTRHAPLPSSVLDSSLSPFDTHTTSINLSEVHLPTRARANHPTSTPPARSPLQTYARRSGLFTESFPDHSLHFDGAFDLRTYLARHSDSPLAAHLVITGGSFLGAVDDIILRRRLAAKLHHFPPSVSERIGMAARRLIPLDVPVQRRILEVYPPIAALKLGFDQELAALALNFLMSAAVFRQPQTLHALVGNLPDALKPLAEKFFRPLLTTQKPELGLLFARYLHLLEESHDH